MREDTTETKNSVHLNCTRLNDRVDAQHVICAAFNTRVQDLMRLLRANRIAMTAVIVVVSAY